MPTVDFRRATIVSNFGVFRSYKQMQVFQTEGATLLDRESKPDEVSMK